MAKLLYLSLPGSVVSDPRLTEVSLMTGKCYAEVLGIWVALVSLFYQHDGLIDLNEESKRRIVAHLAFQGNQDDMDDTLNNMAIAGLLDQHLLHDKSMLASEEVLEDIHDKKEMVERKAKAAQARWSKKDT